MLEYIRISSATFVLKGNESFVDAHGTTSVYLKEHGTIPVTIRKADSGSNVVTVYASGSDTIQSNLPLTYQNDYITLMPIGSGYVVTDSYTQRPTLTNPTIEGTGTAVLSKINPVAATGVLSISDVVKDGETVTICEDVYEFCSDAAQTLTEGSTVAVNIIASTTASTGTLTLPVNPTATDTMTIGETAYTFVAIADFDTAGEIPIGTNIAATQVNVVAAINGTDGVNDAHTLVSIGSFSANAATITALTKGTVGDTIATTETFTAETNVFGAETLESGADCTAANAITALVSAINTYGTEGVTAADGAGDTLTLIAEVGAAGNAIATTETMANGAFAHTTMVGGADIGMALPLFTNMTHEVTVNTHSYASAHADWVLTSAEQLKPVHKVTLADAGVNAIIPVTPSIPYTFINASGQALTVVGASGTGTEIANAKTATVMSDGTNIIRLTPDA